MKLHSGHTSQSKEDLTVLLFCNSFIYTVSIHLIQMSTLRIQNVIEDIKKSRKKTKLVWRKTKPAMAKKKKRRKNKQTHILF